MTAFALKGLLGRKLRTALTAIAIVLGVAMVSGTFVLTDSIDKAFDSIFTDSRQGSDVVVSGKSAFDLGDDTGSSAPTFPVSLLDKVREVDGVAEAEGGVDGTANLIGDDGKAVVYGGAPNLGFSISNGDSPFNPLTLTEGAWPKANEVVIDGATADKEDFKVGETVGVQGTGAVEKLRVSGPRQVRLGLDDRRRDARRLRPRDRPAALQQGTASSTRSRSPRSRASPTEQLIEEIKPVLPADAQVVSSTEQAAEDASDTNEFIKFLRIFLLVFGGVALFVGSFVIANSLSITIAQRTREFATLRTLGASRRQVLVSILLESLVVGTLAAIDRSLPRARPREGCSSGSSTSPASRCRIRACSSAPGRSSSRCSSASSSPSSRASARPSARRGCRRSRPCARGRRSRSRVSHGSASWAPSRSPRSGLRSLLWSLFGASGTGPVLLFLGLGAVLALPRRRALRVAARAAASLPLSVRSGPGSWC